MSDSIERIYCCDNRCNNDPLTMASMLGRNGFGNNFAELFILLLATRMFGGFGFGENGFGFGQGQHNVEMQNQLQAIRTQLQDNQNLNCLQRAVDGNAADLRQLANTLNCDFNTLQQCCCDLKQAMATIGGQIGYSKEAIINAVNMGDCNVIQAIKDCCCSTQKEILKMGYEQQLATCQQTGELRNGQRDLGFAITDGFSKVGYQQSADKCEILRAGEVNTQRIIDEMRNHWADEKNIQITDLKNQLANAQLYEKLRACGISVNNGCCNSGCGF